MKAPTQVWSAICLSCQAEFASSAVDFLHRVGRTARAGQHGVVTSLFTESNRDLVTAVRQAELLGLAVVRNTYLLHDIITPFQLKFSHEDELCATYL